MSVRSCHRSRSWTIRGWSTRSAPVTPRRRAPRPRVTPCSAVRGEASPLVADPHRADLLPAAPLQPYGHRRTDLFWGAVGVDVPPAVALDVEPDVVDGHIGVVAVGDGLGPLD